MSPEDLREAGLVIVAVSIALGSLYMLASIASDLAAFVQCYVRGTCF